jgi:hypothetical protein
MITYTADHVRRAEDIILGEDTSYSFTNSFNFGRLFGAVKALKLGRNRKRDIQTEAALIDRFLAYDNEGNRVLVKADTPSEEAALRARLHCLRPHLDQDFLTDALRTEKERRDPRNMRLATMDLLDEDRLPFPEKMPDISPDLYYFYAIEQDLANREAFLQENPLLTDLSGKADQDTAYAKMLETAGIAGYAAKLHTYSPTNSLATLVTEGDVFPDSALPLLRESCRDELGLQNRIRFANLTDAELRPIQDLCPLVMKFHKAYLRRVETMRQEANKIEQALLEITTTDLTDRALRASPAFTEIASIELHVNEELFNLVQRIVQETRAAESEIIQQPAPRRRIRPGRATHAFL